MEWDCLWVSRPSIDGGGGRATTAPTHRNLLPSPPRAAVHPAGIIEGAAHGKGRGREVIAVARSADLVLMVLDGGKEQVNNHRTILERCVAACGGFSCLAVSVHVCG